MKFPSSIGPVGPEEISSLAGAKLLTVFNEIRTRNGESATKRFSDTRSGRQRTLSAYLVWKSRQPQRATPIPPSGPLISSPPRPTAQATRVSTVRETHSPAARVVNFTPRGGPIQLEVADEVRTHKPSTCRGKLIQLGCRPEGVTMREAEELTGWSPAQVRACLRQIHSFSGHGIDEREPNRFYISGSPRSRKELSWPPKSDIRPHRPGTKRALAVELLTRPGGATFEEIRTACGWTKVQAYEGIKLIHAYLGYGISESDGVIRAFRKEDRK